MQKKLLTLCLAYEHPRILLGMKKRGFGQGRWNGFGGKVEPGETIENAARRELLEESGLTAGEMEHRGILNFEFKGDPVAMEVHVFHVKNYTGEPNETEEMRPAWFDVSAIPLDKMWPDDKHWLPLFVEGKRFEGRFVFEDMDNIIHKELVELV